MFGRATITLGIGPHSSFYCMLVVCICEWSVSSVHVNGMAWNDIKLV